jgi:hypothetical protein
VFKFSNSPTPGLRVLTLRSLLSSVFGLAVLKGGRQGGNLFDRELQRLAERGDRRAALESVTLMRAGICPESRGKRLMA